MFAFTLPAFDIIEDLLYQYELTDGQYLCSDHLYGCLEHNQFIINYFNSNDVDVVFEQFISACSRYISYLCVSPDSTNQNLKIKFSYKADQQFNHLGIQCIYYVRESRSMTTFVELSLAFITKNVIDYGINTQQWKSISLHDFEYFGCQEDIVTIDFGLSTQNQQFRRLADIRNEVRERNQMRFNAMRNVNRPPQRVITTNEDSYQSILDQLFYDHSRNLINNKFSRQNKHKVIIDQEKFKITDENKEEMLECQLCCSEKTLYVCSKCKYPMCKTCLKHILVTSGECPCCREKNMKVQIVESGNVEGNVNVEETIDETVDENVNEDVNENVSENVNENVNESGNETVDENNDEIIDEDVDETINENSNEISNTSVNGNSNSSVNNQPSFTPEQINEEIEYDINNPQPTPTSQSTPQPTSTSPQSTPRSSLVNHFPNNRNNQFLDVGFIFQPIFNSLHTSIHSSDSISVDEMYQELYQASGNEVIAFIATLMDL